MGIYRPAHQRLHVWRPRTLTLTFITQQTQQENRRYIRQVPADI
jgi:hypothetical protein